MDIYSTIHPEVGEDDIPHGEHIHVVKRIFISFISSLEMLVKREDVVSELRNFETKMDPILQLFELPDVAEQMKNDDSNLFDYLAKNHKVITIITIEEECNRFLF